MPARERIARLEGLMQFVLGSAAKQPKTTTTET